VVTPVPPLLLAGAAHVTVLAWFATKKFAPVWHAVGTHESTPGVPFEKYPLILLVARSVTVSTRGL
jgi:hypothetical protein